MIALLGLIGFAVYFASWQFWAEHHYRAALRALDQGVSSQTQEHLKKAKAHLVLCLQVRPDSLDATFLAARTARRLLVFDDAEDYLRQYKKLNGVPEALDLERTLIKVQRGDLSEEAFLWYCVNHEHPDKVFILEVLVRAYLQTYQLGIALECLDLWLKEQPGALQAVLWRGQIERMVGRYQEAIEGYEHALRLDPECDDGRLNLAEILIYTHKARQAAVHFELLTERQPGSIAAVLGLARCRAEQGRLEEARQFLDRLIHNKPDDPAVLAESGKLLLNTGQLADAEMRFRDALRLAPFDREALYNMYKCLEQRGKHEEAKKYLDESNRVEKDLEEIKAITQQIMQVQFRNDASPRCQVARILMRNGQEKEAKRWLDEAIRVDKLYGPAYLLYAEYYDRMAQPQIAAQYRQRAVQYGTAP